MARASLSPSSSSPRLSSSIQFVRVYGAFRRYKSRLFIPVSLFGPNMHKGLYGPDSERYGKVVMFLDTSVCGVKLNSTISFNMFSAFWCEYVF